MAKLVRLLLGPPLDDDHLTFSKHPYEMVIFKGHKGHWFAKDLISISTICIGIYLTILCLFYTWIAVGPFLAGDGSLSCMVCLLFAVDQAIKASHTNYSNPGYCTSSGPLSLQFSSAILSSLQHSTNPLSSPFTVRIKRLPIESCQRHGLP